jgi:two-component system phosphate regulon sensor histidine kinase PhoR
MRLRKLVWHIFPANLLVTIGTLIAILWYSSSALGQFYTNWIVTALEDRAYLIEEQISELVSSSKIEKLNAFCRRIGRKSSTRITVINPSGTVIADSDENPAKLADHSNRSEIINAMEGKVGSQLRFSASLGVKMLYVAIPLINISPDRQTEKFHVLRMSMPASAIDQTLQNLRGKVAVSGIIVAILAMLAAIIVSRRISKPLEEMTERAEQFSRKDFSPPLAISSHCSLEVGTLAAAMNSMAQELQEGFSTILRQRNELQTILTSMADAIVVIDNDKYVITINTSASRLLEIPKNRSIGKSTQEILRNVDVERLVDKTLQSNPGEVVAEEITMVKGNKLFLQFSGVRLFEDEGNSFGAVIALNDVTHIRRLENIKRDFVANVSHELMTPLTSIKGYTETILHSSLDDREQTEKFLQIILRQTNRLQAIVSDLLELSRIENEIEYNEIHSAHANVKDVLEEAIQVCKMKAEEKDITVQLDCPDKLIATIDGQLIEQATVNLLVNAIKYSDPSSRVEMKAGLRPVNSVEMVEIRVQDFGVGIGQEHLPRLFERFYRSDKARSRELGGTGLGLAIVKHIVQAHNGSINVKSEVGQGTVFTILIPTAPPEEGERSNIAST